MHASLIRGSLIGPTKLLSSNQSWTWVGSIYGLGWVGFGLKITAVSWVGLSWVEIFFLDWVDIRLVRFFWCKMVA